MKVTKQRTLRYVSAAATSAVAADEACAHANEHGMRVLQIIYSVSITPTKAKPDPGWAIMLLVES